MARSMIARQNVKLNLVPGGVPPVLNVSQNDSAYDVHFTLYNGAQLFEIPDDVSIQFVEKKRDGNGYDVGATRSAQIGQCYIWMQKQMTAVPGDQICELILTNTTEDQIGTANFIMRVEPGPVDDDTSFSDSDIAYANQVLAQLGSVAAYKAQLDAQGNEIDQLNTNLAAEVAARQAADNTLQSNINSEASTRATADAALQSQINQLVAPEGAAPSAAEITNARVGADGTVYQTLGDAIRGQVTDVKTALYKTIAPTSYSTGYIGGDGSAVTTDTNYRFSNYIEIPFVTWISTKVSMLSSRGMAFYDGNKTFLGAINGNNCSEYGYTASATPQTINVQAPPETKYIRTTLRSTSVSDVNDFAVTGVYMGDYISDLPKIERTLASAVTDISGNTDSRRISVSFTAGGFITGGGSVSTHTAYSYSNFVYVGGLKSLKMPMFMSGSGASIVLYDKTKTVTRNFKNPSDPLGTVLSIDLTDAEAYIRISCYTSRTSKFYLICDDVVESIAKTFRVLKGEEDVPFSKIIHDGGMTRIFNTIGVIGDSLSSGEMAYGNASGEDTTEYTDMYQYSWIQYLARECGIKAFNFSQGGMNTENFLSGTGGQLAKFQNPDNKCQAYFIALGHNDLNYGVPVGSPSDINISDPTTDPDTYYGNYAHIIALIKQIQPNAKIFCVCMKSSHFAAYNVAIRYMPTVFSNVYVLDFETYYPLLESSWEYTQGHGNAMGYLNYSWQIGTFVDWIIRNNRTDFKYVQFIGTDYDQYIPN